MSIIAITVFVAGYALIASDRVSKTRVALTCAAIMVGAGIVGSDDVFYSHEAGIDWDVIFLLLGMMIIVSVLRHTGVFEYVAIWAVKRANAAPLRIMILLVLVTALGSALLDNVTTVLLIAPVTLLVCDRLGGQFHAVFGGRSLRVQCRRRGHAGRRPAEHHHRQPGGTDVQRLPDPHGPGRARRHDRPDRSAALAAGLRHCRARPSCRRAVAQRARSHPRSRAAHQVRCRLGAGVCGLHRSSGAAHPAVSGGAAGRRCARTVLGAGAIRLPVQRRVGHPAVLRRAVRHGGGPGEDRCRRATGAGSNRADRRQRVTHSRFDSRHLGTGVRHHRQHPLRRHDDAHRDRTGRRDAGPRPPRHVLVGTGAKRRLRRQPDRRGSQRQCRHARNRPALGHSHLVLEVHPQGRGGDRGLARVVGGLPVAAVLRVRLS
ncbi:putative arsenic-transport integral membrane protein ARSB1, partial [Mycobacterium tuberculosis variant africanum GM041182]